MKSDLATTDLYLEEKKVEIQRRAQEQREAAVRVSGTLKPSQIKDEGDKV